MSAVQSEPFVALPRSFYEPGAAVVAPLLLGHWLVREGPDGPCGGPIVETEAYVTGDQASHAFGGERRRNRAMFGPPGHAYVYLIYGFYFCVNAVCCPKGCGEAVLIRAIEVEFGETAMRRRRPLADSHSLTSGPGKLCAALDITLAQDGADLCTPGSGLLLVRNPAANAFVKSRGPVVNGVRIGITKSADLPLRFFLPRSPFLSRKLGRGAPAN